MITSSCRFDVRMTETLKPFAVCFTHKVMCGSEDVAATQTGGSTLEQIAEYSNQLSAKVGVSSIRTLVEDGRLVNEYYRKGQWTR